MAVKSGRPRLTLSLTSCLRCRGVKRRTSAIYIFQARRKRDCLSFPLLFVRGITDEGLFNKAVELCQRRSAEFVDVGADNKIITTAASLQLRYGQKFPPQFNQVTPARA